MKYWMDFYEDSNYGDTEVTLYEKDENDESNAVISFHFDEVPGLNDEDDVAESYNLIDQYIEHHLGFLPEYEVG